MAATVVYKPACMSQREMDEWLEAAYEVKARSGSGRRYTDLGITPCRDCTRSFANEMRAEGRCDGVPGPKSEMTEFELRAENAAACRRWRARNAAA